MSRRPVIRAHGLVLPVDDVPLLVDVACGAGLAGDGYAMAGLPPALGLDVEPQPDYPYPFRQIDALEWLQESDEPDRFTAIHTSWPCQEFTRAKHLRKAQGGTSKWPDLLTPGLAVLRDRWNHVPWVVENVDAPEVVRIMAPRPGEHLVRLCGSSFRLHVRRHRWFLANFPLRQPPCAHDTFPIDPITGKPRPWGVYHVPSDNVPSGGRTARDAEHGRRVMGVYRTLPWDTLKEGFPPAYTAHIGADLVRHLAARAAA